MTINELRNLNLRDGKIITLFPETTSGATAFYFDNKTNEFVGLITTDGGDYEEYYRNKHFEEVISELSNWLRNY